MGSEPPKPKFLAVTPRGIIWHGQAEFGPSTFHQAPRPAQLRACSRLQPGRGQDTLPCLTGTAVTSRGGDARPCPPRPRAPSSWPSSHQDRHRRGPSPGKPILSSSSASGFGWHCSCHPKQRFVLRFSTCIWLFGFLPGKALAYLKTISGFPVILGVIQQMTTLPTNLALLMPMNHSDPPSTLLKKISFTYSPVFLVHGQPVALRSPAPHLREQPSASSHQPPLCCYFLCLISLSF